MALTPGTRLGVYAVTAKIGECGMGEVYRARDTRLDRDVALKVLPADMAEDPERLERFQREARAVAALNHPNIVTIYSVEKADDTHFLTMELVEGTTLEAALTDEGLSQERFLELASPLASAVAAAHTKGITHRDLKPQNVMLGRDGGLKVLDFGLARFAPTEASGAPASGEEATILQTQEGLAVGTVPYMSPEQVEGRAVDPRSDIFSLGVMFYEMATGRRPFAGASSMAVASSILRDEPSSISDVKPGFPNTLTEVIGRCLAKDPSARYQDGQALHAALSKAAEPRSQPVATTVDMPWIAVLPFKTRTTDDELEALAEGLTEDITAGLSLFSHLLVVSASSAARYEGPVDARLVGQELGAHFVIDGSIRKARTTIRVRVRLVDTATGTHLWAEHLDRDVQESDVFAVQDALTDRIVATIADPQGVLTRALGAMATAKSAEMLTTYECLVRFFTYEQQVQPQEHAVLRSALEQAVSREPDHADAWACLAILYVHEFLLELNPRPDSQGRALRAAQRAVALDPTRATVHNALAQSHYCRAELGPFRRAAGRVAVLNPRDTAAIGQLGLMMAFSGDWSTGLAVVERVMQQNPHHVSWLHFGHLWDHYRKGEYEQALDVAEQINMPGNNIVSIALASTHAQMGHQEPAREHLDTLVRISPQSAGNPRGILSKWLMSDELVEHIVDGLRKAGLDVEGDDATARGTASEVVAPLEPRRPFVGRQAE